MCSCVLEYVTKLMDLLFNKVIHDPAPFLAELEAVPVPDFLCSQYERVDKAEAISSKLSRFSSTSKLAYSFLLCPLQ